MTITLLQGDAIEKLETIRTGSVQTVITSPPYYGLRRYTNDPREIGQEAAPDCLAWAAKLPPCGACYVCALRAVFAALWRVLRDDGTCWINLGDSMAGNGNRSGEGEARALTSEKFHGGKAHLEQRRVTGNCGVPEKNLLLIPARVALALQSDGWIVRSAITWCKGNPMPESVQDRPSKATEMLFMFSKSARYFYDIEATRVFANRLNRGHGADELRLEQGFAAPISFAAKRREISFNDQWAPYLILATLFSAKRILVQERNDLLGKCFDILNNPRCAGVGLAALAMAVKPASDILSDVIEHLRIVITQGDPQTEAELWITFMAFSGSMKGNDTSFSVEKAREVIAKIITNAQILRHTVPLDTLTKSAVDIDAIEQAVPLLECIGLNAGQLGDGFITDALIEHLNLALGNVGVEESGSPRHDDPLDSVMLIPPDYTTKPQTTQARNLWDWWIVNTRPFKGSHFAVMPEALIEPCLLASSSAQACEHCGAAWGRVVERTEGENTEWKQSNGATNKHAGRIDQGLNSTKSGFNKGSKADYYANAPRNITTGFAPRCACADNAGAASSVVLDCFAGTGTVLRVAERFGRNAIGIELNPDYTELSDARTNGVQKELFV